MRDCSAVWEISGSVTKITNWQRQNISPHDSRRTTYLLMMCRITRRTVSVCRRSADLSVSTLGHVTWCWRVKRHLTTVLIVMMMMVMMVVMVWCGCHYHSFACLVVDERSATYKVGWSAFKRVTYFSRNLQNELKRLAQLWKATYPAIIFLDVPVTIATPMALYSCCWNLFGLDLWHHSSLSRLHFETKQCIGTKVSCLVQPWWNCVLALFGAVWPTPSRLRSRVWK